MADLNKHVYVPKHSKLSSEAVEQLLKKYNIAKKQLPLISKNDAAIKTLDAKPGDVIEISRESTTSGTALFYRIVH